MDPSVLWKGLLLGFVRGRLAPTGMVWINRASGLVIGAFGVLALAAAWAARTSG
jgi:hypothetical protein